MVNIYSLKIFTSGENFKDLARPWVYVKIIHRLQAFSILPSALRGPSAIAELPVFFKMAAIAILDLWDIFWDHPQKVFGGLYHWANFGWNPFSSFL